MGYLLDAFRKNLWTHARGPVLFPLLAEQIPVIQPLHIHQEMIDQREVRDADDGRYQDIENRLTHIALLLNSTTFGDVTSGIRRHVSAGALNAGKPIEKPQADRSGDVENHFSDFDLDLTVLNGCRRHRDSF